MHDIKWIRDNPDAFDAAMKRRGLEPLSAKILEMDKEVRGSKTDLQALQQEMNATAKQIGVKKAAGEDVSEIIAKTSELKKQIAALKDQDKDDLGANSPLTQLLAGLPNIMDESVPDGKDESDNEEIKKIGKPRFFEFTPKDHVDVGEGLGMLNFEQAAKMSGARFAVMQGGLAHLERALQQFALDNFTTQFGYKEASVPFLVKDEAVFGTAQLPKFAEDLFKTTDDRWLIPTSEVPLTNLVRESIQDAEHLPLRFTALTPCFRSEAGSAGKDTRGLIRMHQFIKVELVHICQHDQGKDEHELLLSASESILKALDLPYRVVTLCSGDTGFGAKKTYDIEVWMPGQDTYREVSSCSWCGDFQARRMNARYRFKDQKNTEFCHTLNGTGLSGRVLVSLLENYQQEDGSVAIPSVLQPYMNGHTSIIADAA